MLVAGVAVVALVLALRARRRREAAEHREWSIGIFEGPSPLELRDPPEIDNPVLTAAQVKDARAEFVADPFLLRRDSRWFMFFEVLEVLGRRRRGSIGVATSPDARSWTYDRIVLREPFHVSYPFVFEDDGDVYMVPESYGDKSVRLYRAKNFPHDWVLEATLLSGQPWVDSTLVRHRGRWWMFTSLPSNDELHLFSADALRGPWTPHPGNPVVRGNLHTARPGGRVVEMDGRLVRFAQDDAPFYGRQVLAFEITRLDGDAYVEAPIGPEPILGASGSGWNMDQMHHLDAHFLESGTWIACVDGRGQPPKRR